MFSTPKMNDLQVVHVTAPLQKQCDLTVYLVGRRRAEAGPGRARTGEGQLCPRDSSAPLVGSTQFRALLLEPVLRTAGRALLKGV